MNVPLIVLPELSRNISLVGRMAVFYSIVPSSTSNKRQAMTKCGMPSSYDPEALTFSEPMSWSPQPKIPSQYNTTCHHVTKKSGGYRKGGSGKILHMFVLLHALLLKRFRYNRKHMKFPAEPNSFNGMKRKAP